MTLRGEAFVALAGVGDAKLGEWQEWTGYAFHVRRRLSAEEQQLVGEAIDLRGTWDAPARLEAMEPFLHEQLKRLARDEMRSR